MFSPPPLHLTDLGWLAALGGALAIGMNKGGLAGLGILPVVIFAMIFPPRESTGFILPLLIIGDLGGVVVYRHQVVWKIFWRLLPPTFAGVVLGYFLMSRMAGSAFGPVIGWIIIGLIALQFLRGSLGEKLDRFFESHGFGLIMGVLVGVTTMLANAAGPVAILYFISVGLPKWNLIGTSAWVFWVMNLCKLPFSAELGLTNVASLTFAVMLAPLVMIGFVLGRYLAGAMPQTIFERFVLILTAVGALKLVL